jgi:hypothetical protein
VCRQQAKSVQTELGEVIREAFRQIHVAQSHLPEDVETVRIVTCTFRAPVVTTEGRNEVVLPTPVRHAEAFINPVLTFDAYCVWTGLETRPAGKRIY